MAWDSRRAEHARHVECEGDWQAPSSHAVARMVDDAFKQMRSNKEAVEVLDMFTGDDDPLVLEQLTRDEIIDMRAAARKDPALITSIIDVHGEAYARQLFTNALVDQTLRPRGTSLMVIQQPWASA